MPATAYVNHNPSDIAHSPSYSTNAQANACQQQPALNTCPTYHRPTSQRPAQHPNQVSPELPQAPPQQLHTIRSH
eukprot:scaffold501585_cov18-Prasinocladus_malaysianus.AAC.2